jgi:hypothetical protein
VLTRFRDYCGLLRFARSVSPWEKTAAGNLAERGYVLVRDLHYETVMVAILVVQAKMFLGGLNLHQHPIGREQIWIVTVLPDTNS